MSDENDPDRLHLHQDEPPIDKVELALLRQLLNRVVDTATTDVPLTGGLIGDETDPTSLLFVVKRVNNAQIQEYLDVWMRQSLRLLQAYDKTLAEMAEAAGAAEAGSDSEGKGEASTSNRKRRVKRPTSRRHRKSVH